MYPTGLSTILRALKPHSRRQTMIGNYALYHEELIAQIKRLRQQVPEPMRGFSQLSRSAVADEGALSGATKELIAIGIAIATHCEGCIALHVKAALRAGATPQEIVEVLGVAILMGGGPAMIYSGEALNALEQFANAPLPHPD
jgi:AhpD family alkylhydroperoxidase